MSENIAAAKEIIAKGLGRSVAEVDDNAAMGLTEGWDSLAHMRILLEAEAVLGRQIDAGAAATVENVKSLAAVLDSEKSV